MSIPKWLIFAVFLAIPACGILEPIAHTGEFKYKDLTIDGFNITVGRASRATKTEALLGKWHAVFWAEAESMDKNLRGSVRVEFVLLDSLHAPIEICSILLPRPWRQGERKDDFVITQKYFTFEKYEGMNWSARASVLDANL